MPRGGIFGLLGPNGAGKSTTIRMILSIILPDEGRVTLFGGEPASRDLSERIGYLPEERGLYPRMKVAEQLTSWARPRGCPGSARPGRSRRSGWSGSASRDWGDKKVQDLSKGMQQKVQFIGALLHEPELVILDEPFSGLDPVNSQVMRDVVVEIARAGRHGAVLDPHHGAGGEDVRPDRDHRPGREGGGWPAGRHQERGGRRGTWRSSFHRNPEAAARVLADRALVARVDDYGASAEAELAEGAASDRLLRALVSADVGHLAVRGGGAFAPVDLHRQGG